MRPEHYYVYNPKMAKLIVDNPINVDEQYSFIKQHKYKNEWFMSQQNKYPNQPYLVDMKTTVTMTMEMINMLLKTKLVPKVFPEVLPAPRSVFGKMVKAKLDKLKSKV